MRNLLFIDWEFLFSFWGVPFLFWEVPFREWEAAFREREFPFLNTQAGVTFTPVDYFGTNAGNEQINGKPAWAAGCNLYRKRGNEPGFTLIAFDTASPYMDTITGPAVDVSYKAAYRGVRATDEGGRSAEQKVAAGG